MTQTIYYMALFGLSLILTLIFVFQWRKNFDVHMTIFFILIPLTNLAYMLMYATHSVEAGGSMLKIVYFGGCFLPWLITMCILQLCRIEVGRAARIIPLLVSAVVFLSVLTIGHFDIFYRTFSVQQIGSAIVQYKEYGPFHFLHYIVISLYLIADFIALIYSYRKKKQVSRRVLFLLFLPIPISMLGYIANHYMIRFGLEIMPFTYVLAQIVYLLIVRRMVLYNVSEMIIESEVQAGENGFITVDLKGRYLGSNETAKRILPALCDLVVDRPVQEEEGVKDTVAGWLEDFRKDPANGKHLYSANFGGDVEEEHIYTVLVRELYDDEKQCGYQIYLQDDTQNQKYIRLLDQYNTDLQADVEAKTERIVAMHDRLILGMAVMVESRDNSTGGHIRRTSEGVRILIDTIREDGSLALSDDFCRNIIKAAPMHDLGKIAVDDAVLRKAGPFTPEEREKMQKHAAEGARIVHSILEDTDDEEFRKIAENVAHYHHERYDGAGYPDGLKGEDIPLEARIMSVADVYDALVSKRVYKEKFSFEKADSIILEGMGTQFDPALQRYYEKARPKLEAYYMAE